LFIDNISIGLNVGIGSPMVLRPNLHPDPTDGAFVLNAWALDTEPSEIVITDIRGMEAQRNMYPPTGGTGIRLDARTIGLAHGVYGLRVSTTKGTGSAHLGLTR
jgi:hypothetical protein